MAGPSSCLRLSSKTRRRQSRLARSEQARTRSRRNHASAASGSRKPRIPRQASTSASWTASCALSSSRRIRRASAVRRAIESAARAENAAWSPFLARLTSSRSKPSSRLVAGASRHQPLSPLHRAIGSIFARTEQLIRGVECLTTSPSTSKPTLWTNSASNGRSFLLPESYLW